MKLDTFAKCEHTSSVVANHTLRQSGTWNLGVGDGRPESSVSCLLPARSTVWLSRQSYSMSVQVHIAGG